MARRRELHDEYFRKAKAEGYVARSAYKLLQINERKRLMRRGDRVLDLGCAPGSWLQVASKLVGPRGVVAGLDLQEVTLPPLVGGGGVVRNVRVQQGDVFAVSAEELLALGEASEEGYDVVLSDMAPATEGGAGASGDHFRSVALCRRVMGLLPTVLRQGGNMAMKVFEGESYPGLLREAAGVFIEAKGFKPDASRDVSREIYIVGKGYRPPAARREPRAAQGVAPPPPRVSEGWAQ